MENVKSDWDWGFPSGKVSAIRWVPGDEWDMLEVKALSSAEAGPRLPAPGA